MEPYLGIILGLSLILVFMLGAGFHYVFSPRAWQWRYNKMKARKTLWKRVAADREEKLKSFKRFRQPEQGEDGV
jgi:hypothetical protein